MNEYVSKKIHWKKVTLTKKQFTIFVFLWHYHQQYKIMPRQIEISNFFNVSQQAVSKYISALRDNGLIGKNHHYDTYFTRRSKLFADYCIENKLMT
tara:strand:+ start:608 stop:895 length:288 start_codon:yes stop_codon:yes gene_type:complete